MEKSLIWRNEVSPQIPAQVFTNNYEVMAGKVDKSKESRFDDAAELVQEKINDGEGALIKG